MFETLPILLVGILELAVFAYVLLRYSKTHRISLLTAAYGLALSLVISYGLPLIPLDSYFYGFCGPSFLSIGEGLPLWASAILSCSSLAFHLANTVLLVAGIFAAFYYLVPRKQSAAVVFSLGAISLGVIETLFVGVYGLFFDASASFPGVTSYSVESYQHVLQIMPLAYPWMLLIHLAFYVCMSLLVLKSVTSRKWNGAVIAGVCAFLYAALSVVPLYLTDNGSIGFMAFMMSNLIGNALLVLVIALVTVWQLKEEESKDVFRF